MLLPHYPETQRSSSPLNYPNADTHNCNQKHKNTKTQTHLATKVHIAVQIEHIISARRTALPCVFAVYGDLHRPAVPLHQDTVPVAVVYEHVVYARETFSTAAVKAELQETMLYL